MAAQTDRGVPLSTLSPKFLHSNSTSHTWPFSAIAELIDNAYDPDVSAKQFWIDKTVIKGELCLTFMDNGNGLDHDAMHKMLSFGYSDKMAVGGKQPIGIYGNGFKSGSMRLGKDVIVFSKSKSTLCVGMLSQTYLRTIDAKQIIVPIVCFERESNKFNIREKHKASLRDILRYSLFKTKEELLTEIDIISSSGSTKETGTRIIIWNLRRTSTGTTEFDFDTDRYDIRIRSETLDPTQSSSSTPESLNSLRVYCSILYLKPRMQVVVRGQKVKSQLIAKSLAYIIKDHYKPNFLNRSIPITFGYNTKSKDQYGIMMYHKNRLIKAYERVGCQFRANNEGVGVIGVIECNFLDPTHNKQSFMETDRYRKTMNNLGIKLKEYWKEIRHRKTKEDPTSTIPVEDTLKRPDQNWAQCDDCLSWRKLPDGIDISKLPDKWFCRMNPDPQFRSCKVEEEREDSDDEQSYQKTYKQQEREDRKKEEQKIQQHFSALARRVEFLRPTEESLVRQLHETSTSTPTTPRSRSMHGGAARAESSLLGSSAISQAACSPSSDNGLLVISNVRSLSADVQRGKRAQHVPPHSTPKKPRVNGVREGFSDTPSAANMGSPFVPVDVKVVANDDSDTDDDLLILETGSTPKPKQPVFNPNIVKTEKGERENHPTVLLECSDDAAMDVTSEATAGVSASVATSPPTEMVTTTTQTNVSIVKQEEDQNKSQGKQSAPLSASSNGVALRSSDMDIRSLEHREFKQECGGEIRREDQGKHAAQNGVTDMERDEIAGPSYAYPSSNQYPSITEVQKQQDQLVELMQDTAQERDRFKDQVQKLTSQLQDMQNRLPQLSQMNVKKEWSHQACQTEETVHEKDYKSLFEKAKQKVNDLIKDKETLIAAAETKTSVSNAADEEKDIDEISLQVGCVVQELDQRTKERDELRSKLDALEEEKSSLAAQCEGLRLSLQQQMEKVESQHRTINSSHQSHPQGAGMSAHSSSDTSRSLIELRHNVGRLLIPYWPALELDQVNYESDVIDEILEQVLSTMN
ncbi:MORC family CW-type zinc finger protein 3a isoform 2-T2 [Odontesthes bonariensis]|uniref:MORC family CW-type zinc finger protein 3a isoform X2 n=1 Tax=Odontesthes bonariensis TaxID=219752 RepID=UPI003F58B703